MQKGKHVHDKTYYHMLLSRSVNNLSRSDALAIAKMYSYNMSLNSIRRNENNNNINNNLSNMHHNINNIINNLSGSNNNIINNNILRTNNSIISSNDGGPVNENI